MLLSEGINCHKIGASQIDLLELRSDLDFARIVVVHNMYVGLVWVAFHKIFNFERLRTFLFGSNVYPQLLVQMVFFDLSKPVATILPGASPNAYLNLTMNLGLNHWRIRIRVFNSFLQILITHRDNISYSKRQRISLCYWIHRSGFWFKNITWTGGKFSCIKLRLCRHFYYNYSTSSKND